MESKDKTAKRGERERERERETFKFLVPFKWLLRCVLSLISVGISVKNQFEATNEI